jgi:hypothetical protein
VIAPEKPHATLRKSLSIPRKPLHDASEVAFDPPEAGFHVAEVSCSPSEVTFFTPEASERLWEVGARPLEVGFRHPEALCDDSQVGFNH